MVDRARRNWLRGKLRSSSGVPALPDVTVAPAASALWVNVGPASDYPINLWKRVVLSPVYNGAVIYVLRAGRAGDKPGEITALSARCPHNGCVVEWNMEYVQFVCPCHDARFGSQGNVIEGPPPRGLARLSTRVDWLNRLYIAAPAEDSR